MLRRLCLGLLGLLLAGGVVSAQDPGGAAGPALSRPGVRRLPSVEPWPAPGQGVRLPPPAEQVPLPPPTQQGPLPPPAEEVAPRAHAAGTDPQFAPPPGHYAVVQENPEPPEKLWEGSFEIGLDGTEGNSRTFNFRLGLDAKRTTAENLLTLDLDYRQNTSDARQTAHRAFLDGRAERLFSQSPWSCFAHGTVDYDEFKRFDMRVTQDAGLGYQLVQTESTCLAARLGGGFSHEIGGSDERYVPEAVFGMEFEHRLGKRHKLSVVGEYSPDVTDFGGFRVNTRAAWEALIDQKMNLSLKLSVLDRYDSTPDGAEPNDLDYAAVLLWKF